MSRRRPMQLMLALEHQSPPCPVAQNPADLVQALADLLLEALGAHATLMLTGQEASDESQDHA